MYVAEALVNFVFAAKLVVVADVVGLVAVAQAILAGGAVHFFVCKKPGGGGSAASTAKCASGVGWAVTAGGASTPCGVVTGSTTGSVEAKSTNAASKLACNDL